MAMSYDISLDELPEVGWEMVTPSMASEALQYMRPNQRKLREARVESIVNDIQQGNWRITGETIQRGDDGLWDNGQHRLTAILRSGIAVPMLVVRGIDRNARLVLDTGAPRSYQDTLTMRGIGAATFTASVTRRMYMWDTYRNYILRGGGHVRPSPDALDTYRIEHTEEIEAAASLAPDARKCWLTPSVLGTAFILLNRIDKSDTLEFLKGVITGAELSVLDPRFVLREKLRVLHESGKGSPDEKRAWVFIAWNLWRAGRSVTKLQPPRGGSVKQPFTDKNYPLPE